MFSGLNMCGLKQNISMVGAPNRWVLVIFLNKTFRTSCWNTEEQFKNSSVAWGGEISRFLKAATSELSLAGASNH
jgi:hypothetical protein